MLNWIHKKKLKRIRVKKSVEQRQSIRIAILRERDEIPTKIDGQETQQSDRFPYLASIIQYNREK